MRRTLAVLGACASLGACATAGGLNTPHATLERAETLAEEAYANAAPLLTPAQNSQAWTTLMQIRTAYNAGQDITAASTAFVSALPKKGN